MANKLITFLIVAVFLAGLSIAAYPAVSAFISSERQTKVVDGYHESVETLDEEMRNAAWTAAEEYNAALARNGQNFSADGESEEYFRLLDLDGTGVMGTVTIPKIDCSLPIYHGTAENVLRLGAGHMTGSSLPVGGEGSHCVISGHRGLPSSELFTYLDELEIGDRFTLEVLDTELEYEIDSILTVLPDDTEQLVIVEGEDYCTLVTCTPYGINTHRLLVRGSRVN